MATVETLLTADEYLLLPDTGQPTELVRGRVVTMNMPETRHGIFCGNIVYHLRDFLKDHDLGRVTCNDAGVVTERDPDTVRGPDVAYYSYSRLPKGPVPRGYAPAPELVFEVRSPGDTWSEVHMKVGEYFGAGVLVVCVHDSQTERLHIFTTDQPPQILADPEELTLPQVLPGFRVPVRLFFE